MERRLFGLLSCEELVSTVNRFAGRRGNSSSERGSSPGTLLGPEGSSQSILLGLHPLELPGRPFAGRHVSEDLVEEPPVI